jgi:hypothetical protein
MVANHQGGKYQSGMRPSKPDFRNWHETVIAVQPPHVRCRSQSGKHVLGESISHFDPKRSSGPAS